MMPQLPLHDAFILLSTHAKIHQKLDTFSRRQRELLDQVERKEILAYADDVAFAKLELLKRELLTIAFVERKGEEKQLTDPLP